MMRLSRSLLFCLLLPGVSRSVSVSVAPRVPLELGGAAPRVAPALEAPRLTGPIAAAQTPVPGLTPSFVVPTVAVRPQVLPALVVPHDQDGPSNSAQKIFATLDDETADDEKEAAVAARFFDKSAFRTDGLDAVAALDVSVSVTPRGVHLGLSEGQPVKLMVVEEQRTSTFQVWKAKDGYRIRPQGSLASRAIPEKGFFIYRGPVPADEGPDRFTIPDKNVPVDKVQAALTVEKGVLVAQDLGAMMIRDNAVVLLQGVRAEGPFPIERVHTPSGHAFGGGAIRYKDETIAVDWDKDSALSGYYEKVKKDLARRAVGSDELSALSTVFDSVLRDVQYDQEMVSERIALLNGRRGVLLGELMGLSEEHCVAVGVCRHTAVLLGAVLERLIQEGRGGFKGGKVYYVGGKGHAWAVYRDSRGGYHILDAAQRHRPVPLDEQTSYTGEVLDGKGQFAYADDMTAELKNEWKAGFPSFWKVAADQLWERLKGLKPGPSKKELMRRRLERIRKG